MCIQPVEALAEAAEKFEYSLTYHDTHKQKFAFAPLGEKADYPDNDTVVLMYPGGEKTGVGNGYSNVQAYFEYNDEDENITVISTVTSILTRRPANSWQSITLFSSIVTASSGIPKAIWHLICTAAGSPVQICNQLARFEVLPEEDGRRNLVKIFGYRSGAVCGCRR